MMGVRSLNRKDVAAQLVGQRVPVISKEKLMNVPEHVKNDPEALRLLEDMDRKFAKLEALRQQIDGALAEFRDASEAVRAKWEGNSDAASN